MTLNPERLRKVKTVDDVLKYLSDELDWPISAANLENATFDYTPEELGIPAERLPHLERLRQLRPITANQPWGIFFLEFSGPRLPITPLRRLLQVLVAKKRAGGGGDKKTWGLDDLLFIISTDAGDTVELHLLAFFGVDSPTVEIRSLPWRPGQSPNQHMRRLASELLPHLEWPDDPSDTAGWRAEWREAFKLRLGEAIRSAATLAERMARTGIDLRVQITAALVEERENGPFSRLLDEVHRELVADVDEDRFADMCAQTLVYGVLSSRVTDPIGFGASPNLSSVPLSNPFLAAFFEQVHDQALELDLEGSGLDQLVADLRESNVEAILDQFGSTAKGGDPVIHFYEEFLKQYDRKMRADAGAFYTPQPVVEFMVRAVDELLRSRFHLEMGLADNATWASVAERNGFKVPEGVDADHPFVSMLDPATGTGTFLVAWLRQARRSFNECQPKGHWLGYLSSNVLPEMHAFELMLGPYAIAHLKVALELHDEGADSAGVMILLTDTLDYEPPQLSFDVLKDPVAAEGQLAADLKRAERFTVVIGNPPYDREQRVVGDHARRKGGVVRHGAPGIRPLLEDLITPLRENGLGHHAKNLYNDYIYFWRWAIWQAAQKPPGPGIVAFITASSFLDGVSSGGLRSLMRREFDEIWFVDLGGDGRGARQSDDNIFDILTPVAITIAIKTGIARNSLCKVNYLRIDGSREDKLKMLAGGDLMDLQFESVEGQGIDRFTPISGADYHTWLQVSSLFPWIQSGSQPKRNWVIGPSKSILSTRWRELLKAVPRRRSALLVETRDRTTDKSVRALFGDHVLSPINKLTPDDKPEAVLPYGWRSFDRQWIIADNRVLDYARPGFWKANGTSQIFLATLTTTQLGSGPAATVTCDVPDMAFFRGSYGAQDMMPLYRDALGKNPNVTRGLLAALSDRLSSEISAEDLLAYVFGLTGTSAFTDRFRSELDQASGPFRVPITTDVALFRRAVDLGSDLLWWQTRGSRFAPHGNHEGLPIGRARELTQVQGCPDDYSYEAEDERLVVGTGTFGPIPVSVWEFEVSGLKVLQSWLAYRMASRKGRKSSELDDIGLQRWTFSTELLELISILEHTIEVTPSAATLLKEIIDSALIDGQDLPMPTAAERKAPKG